MAVIENFAALSEQEQQKFAATLLKTINSEKTFIDDNSFKIDRVEADDFTGGLIIEVSHTEPIEVVRPATWSANNTEDVNDTPEYPDYINNMSEDVKAAFKTTETIIDGYKVSLEIVDVDETDTVDIEVDSYEDADDGIGSYEYCGVRGYDSDPYISVEGTIIKACDCALVLYVDPADAVDPVTPVDPEDTTELVDPVDAKDTLDEI